jgi:poly(A) polymerase
MKYLDELNLLMAVFPEFEVTRGVTQPKEHHWNVLDHSIATVSALEYLLGEGEWEYTGTEVLDSVPWSAALTEHFNQKVSSGSTRKSLLKLAALLHDSGKPGTRAADDNGRLRFLGHSKEGAGVVSGMLERLRFSSREIKLVVTEVNHHMRPTQMSQEGMPTDRAIYRYFRDTGDTGIDILYLSLADHLATRGPGLDIKGWREHTELVDYVLEKHFDKENVIHTPKIVDGYDIMKSFRLAPGAEIGRLLEAVREAQASGEVSNREEALTLVEKLIASHETHRESKG